ncbi:beta strand repeat-containing protein [Algiphilus sp.]|uniref:beta strand repeat-containing protein n=1 Tax=Algiphilus sp. TaxID=1872431 RepID=UPI003B51B575
MESRRTGTLRRRGMQSALLMGGVLLAGQAMATDYVVTNLDDDVATGDGITLREAVEAARTNSAVGDAPAGEEDGDTIGFDPGLLDVNATVTLDPAQGPLRINDDLLIDGSADLPPITVSIDANGIQAFVIDAAGGVGSAQAVSIANLSVTNGSSADNGGAIVVSAGSSVSLDAVDINNSVANGMAANQGGGAIYNAGNLTINGGEISSNSAPMGSGSGGAIFNDEGGTLAVTGTLFNNNSAQRAGGAIEARANSTTTLDDVTLNANATGPMPGNGGGLHITGAGDATITGGEVSDNTAAAEGGGLWNGFGTMQITGTTISGNSASGDDAANGGGGVFNNEGTVTITGATISANSADGDAGSGGGILNKGSDVRTGSVTVTDTAITGNSSNRAGGGIETTGATSTTLSNVTLSGNSTGDAPGNGGGLHISGSGNVSITGGTIDGNTAAREGGGLWNGAGLMSVDGTVITNNEAAGAAADDGGGGIFNNTGRVELNAVTISGNSATGAAGSGGGIFNLGPDSAMPDRGVVVVSGGEISGNSAIRAGGGIEATPNTTTDLSGGLVLSNNTAGAAPGNGGGMHITGAGDASLSNVTVSGNTASAEGGGLWNGAGTMTVANSSIANNIAEGADADQGGGGLFNLAGALRVTDSMVTGNRATGAAGSGGGILNTGSELTVTGGTVSDNTAVRAGGGIEDNNSGGASSITLTRLSMQGNSVGPSPGNGGAFHVTGGDATILIDRSTASGNTAANEGGGLWNFSEAEMIVVNSTISGNAASGNGGGGLFNQPTGDLTLINTTVANNDTTGDGGGVLNADTGVVSLSNSLIGSNTATGAGPDISGAVSASFTLVADSSGASISGSNNQSDIDPMIGMLAANGGSTQTHALNDGSPAIDAADDAVCAGMRVNGVDQREVPREDAADGGCDIGAFERVPGPVAVATNNRSVDELTVTAGDVDVPLLAFSLSNPVGSDENLRVDGFSGALDSVGDVQGRLNNPRLVLDTNSNGVVDGGESVVADATVNLDLAAGRFTVTFDPPRVIPAGASESYLIAVDVAAGNVSSAGAISESGSSQLALLAGGAGAPLLALGMIGAPRRRGWVAAAAVFAAACLSACDGTSPRLGADDGNPTSVRAALDTVDAEGTQTGLPPQGLELPQEGLRIIFDDGSSE